jgi:hypothetical protein
MRDIDKRLFPDDVNLKPSTDAALMNHPPSDTVEVTYYWKTQFVITVSKSIYIKLGPNIPVIVKLFVLYYFSVSLWKR